MKLLQVVWNFPDTVMRPFDMYYFYWPVHEALTRGWEVEVLTFQVHKYQPAEEIIDGIRVHRCPAGVRKGRPFSWPFIHALLTTNADIIHCHGYAEGRSEIALLLAHLRRRKVVFSPYFHIYPNHRPLRDLYDKTLGRFFFNLSDQVIVSTEYTRQKLLLLGVHADKLQVVPHVSRPQVFANDAHGEEAGRLLRQADISGDPLILGVGQIIERKGWEYIIRCMPSIVTHFPKAKLLIIGPSKPTEPEFHQRLLQVATELGVIDHLQIVQDNPPEFIRDAFRSATILTHPSFVESFGLVLLEAMTAGVPVVAHNGTGIPCVIDNGVTGYVVDVRDTPKYTEVLLLLLNDPALRQRLGSEGRRQAETRFSQAEIASQLFALYAEVMGVAANKDPTQPAEAMVEASKPSRFMNN